ncbi:integrase, catalytic region, zinc finger, CCHC-type containing protein [Tanacetum coccineum]
MSTANQQTLMESRASDRPPIFEKGSYVPWASQFLWFLENKKEEGELMRDSIFKGPYKRKDIPDPNSEPETIPEPISKMSKPDKELYFADIRVMNYIRQGIPSDIYNSLDACRDAKQMWARIKRLVQGSDISKQERHSRLLIEFDKFVAVKGESLTSVYERFSTLTNVMDRNDVRPQEISINTKFLNSLQPEWSKYVTMTRQKYTLETTKFDLLFDHLSQFESNFNASKAKKAARNHDPLALVANSYAHSSNSMQVLHTLVYHNHIMNPRAESTPGKTNIQCYNYNEKGHYVCECPKPKVHDAKYFKEQMLLATKDEAGVHLDKEENDFMLDNAYGDNTLEELNAAVIMMACIQPTDDKSNAKPTYDDEFISEVNASQVDMINGLLSKSDHEQCQHEKLETIIHTSADDQIDSDIISDDPYMDNNSGQAEHDTNTHDQSLHDFESLTINVQIEAEKQRKMNIKLKRQKRCYNENLRRIRNGVYDPYLKTGLGYENPERLKKAIEAQPKMYDGEKLESTKLKVDLPNYKETLEDTEESRLKMKDEMIQLDYAKLNALYESFPSTSNVSSESSSEKSDLPPKKMPNESKLLKLFVNLEIEIKQLNKLINISLQREKERTVIYDEQNEIRKYFNQQKNEMLMFEMEKISNESKDIQVNLLK